MPGGLILYHHLHWCRSSMRLTCGGRGNEMKGWRYDWGSRYHREEVMAQGSWREFCLQNGCVLRGGVTRKKYPRGVSCGVVSIASGVTRLKSISMRPRREGIYPDAKKKKKKKAEEKGREEEWRGKKKKKNPPVGAQLCRPNSQYSPKQSSISPGSETRLRLQALLRRVPRSQCSHPRSASPPIPS